MANTPISTRSLAAALHAQAQKADGTGAGAQSGVPPIPVATERTGDDPDQSAATGMGELLRGWALQRVLQLHQGLVEKKVRRQLAHAQKRKGFGWERWSRPWLYDTLGLFNGYRVRRDRPKVAPAG